jgi:glycogen operon protein
MGDELWRTQGGNNNAYAQDNPVSWLDWAAADGALAAFAAGLVALRRRHRALHDDQWLTGTSLPRSGLPDVEWLRPDGATMAPADWDGATTHALVAVLAAEDADVGLDRVTVALNAAAAPTTLRLPATRLGAAWHLAADSAAAAIHAPPTAVLGPSLPLPPRCVLVLVEVPAGPTA